MRISSILVLRGEIRGLEFQDKMNYYDISLQDLDDQNLDFLSSFSIPVEELQDVNGNLLTYKELSNMIKPVPVNKTSPYYPSILNCLKQYRDLIAQEKKQ